VSQGSSIVCYIFGNEHGLATFPDVRQSQRDLARARTLDEAARAEVWTQAAALAFSTGDLARPLIARSNSSTQAAVSQTE
jgi:outer membrane protein TolC